MYYRIKNRFEVDLLRNLLLDNNVPSIVLERMYEITDILDSNYGTERSSTAMGGYLLFFPTKEDFINSSPTILENYNVDADLYEYDDLLSSSADNISWREKLYLLSSDDSLIFMYMK